MIVIADTSPVNPRRTCGRRFATPSLTRPGRMSTVGPARRRIAGAHHADILLDIEPWRTAWEPAAWCEYLATAEAGADVDAIRRSTHTGRPLGHRDFVAQLEKTLQRRLTPELKDFGL